MDQLIQSLIIGLANGLIFALVALGYTLVYGIIELINFAHGDVFMIGSLIAFALMAPTSVGGFAIFPVTAGTPVPLMIVGIILTLAVTMALTAGLNAGIERVAYRPLRHAPKLAPLDLRDRHELRARERRRRLRRGDPADGRGRLPDEQPARGVRHHVDQRSRSRRSSSAS